MVVLPLPPRTGWLCLKIRSRSASSNSRRQDPVSGHQAARAGTLLRASSRAVRARSRTPISQTSSRCEEAAPYRPHASDERHLDPWAQMAREVAEFGAQGLDKKSAKAFKAAQLAKLGAKEEKRPRMSAKIGTGIKKKGDERESRRLEEMYQAGMLQRKGTGKKKRRDKERERDKGLMELGGSFRGGMLKVKKPTASKKDKLKISF